MLAGTVEALLGVGYFLHPFVADLGEPLFERFGVGKWYRCYEAQELLRVSHVGLSHFAVLGKHFQLSDFFGQLTSLFLQLAFEVISILTGPICTSERLDDIHDR